MLSTFKVLFGIFNWRLNHNLDAEVMLLLGQIFYVFGRRQRQNWTSVEEGEAGKRSHLDEMEGLSRTSP